MDADTPEGIRMVLADPLDSPEDRVRPHRFLHYLVALFAPITAPIEFYRWLFRKEKP